LQIAVPADGAHYVLTGEPDGDRIRLETSLDAHAELHWYLNGRYLGRSVPNAPLHVSLTEGAHQLACITAEGDSEHAVRYAVALEGAARRFKP
jgi:membrane carboxypeptidase/penicillin-binding protein PbpC